MKENEKDKKDKKDKKVKESEEDEKDKDINVSRQNKCDDEYINKKWDKVKVNYELV